MSDRRDGATAVRVARSTASGVAAGWNHVGAQVASTPRRSREMRTAFVRYRKEIIRLVAQMSLGTGALAVIGGTVVIVGFLTLSTGAVIAVQGYNQLSGIGVEAMTGFISAYVNVRIISPAVAGVGLAATIGAGATAQLGAMRIADEIDALEVMAVRSIAYLVSTRVVAGRRRGHPAVLRGGGVRLSGRPVRHDGDLRPVHRGLRPLLPHIPQLDRSAVVVRHGDHRWRSPSCWCTPITATPPRAGPPASGEAVGHSVRTSLIVLTLIVLAISLSVYGQSGHFNLSG